MSALPLLVLSAGMGLPSSSQLLGERLAAAAVEALTADGRNADVRHIELRTLAADLTNYLASRVPSAALRDAFDAVGGAAGVIVVTPVFNASYSGLFKLFFDLLDEGAMRERPVLLAATGGTARHSLVLDYAMLPMFHYLKAAISPTAVFAATGDWGDAEARLTPRIAQAGRDFARLVADKPGHKFGGDFDNPLDFASLLGG